MEHGNFVNMRGKIHLRGLGFTLTRLLQIMSLFCNCVIYLDSLFGTCLAISHPFAVLPYSYKLNKLSFLFK